MRMKGSRPFWVSLLHGFGRDSMSLTLPWDSPRTYTSGRQVSESWVWPSWPLPGPSEPALRPRALRRVPNTHVTAFSQLWFPGPLLKPDVKADVQHQPGDIKALGQAESLTFGGRTMGAPEECGGRGLAINWPSV